MTILDLEVKNTQADFERYKASFLGIAGLLVIMGSKDEEYIWRLDRLAESLREIPQGERDVRLTKVSEDLRALGYGTKRADEILEDLVSRIYS